MTKLILRQGDLFTTDAPALAHGVNVHGVMGSGIAPLFKKRFSGLFREYATACWSGRLVPGGVHIWRGPEITVYNLASQDLPGPNATLHWLERSLLNALADADEEGFDRIALPRIGCGIGGLDWEDVEPLLERLAGEFDCDLEVWTL